MGALAFVLIWWCDNLFESLVEEAVEDNFTSTSLYKPVKKIKR